MANAIQARQPSSADGVHQGGDMVQSESAYRPLAGDSRLGQQQEHQHQGLRASKLLVRPGLGRQMSSVSNLIDAYSRNSPVTSTGTPTENNNSSIVRSSTNANSNSAPNSPSSSRHAPHSQYYSQIITRRSSIQIASHQSSSRRDSSSSELSPLVRERRPSAPEIHSPTSRVMSGAAAAPGSRPGSGVSSTVMNIDIKRLRSKPAPPQQPSTSMSTNQKRHDTPSTAEINHQHRSRHVFAAEPGQQQHEDEHDTVDALVSPLATMLSGTRISSHARKVDSDGAAGVTRTNFVDVGATFVTDLRGAAGGQRQEIQQQASISMMTMQYESQLPSSSSKYHDSSASSSHYPVSALTSSEQPTYWHVDNSSTSTSQLPSRSASDHHHPAGVRSRFDSLTSNSDSGSSYHYHQNHQLQHHTTSFDSAPPARPASPQTPRRVRNSSLPMGSSPTLSSSSSLGAGITGRQSPSSRRPLKPIPPTSSGLSASLFDPAYSFLPGQPGLPPSSSSSSSPRYTKTSSEGEMYESILPTSSILRPNRFASLSHSSNTGSNFVTSPPTTSSAMLMSPIEQSTSTSAGMASPTKGRKDRILSPGSPTPHKKLVRKSSRGHVRKDSGTSGHTTPSSTASTSAPASAIHSRSLSLPRTSSKGSTLTGGTGSGSGSEQDDLNTANIQPSSSYSHLFSLAQRPAWLDQDPAAACSQHVPNFNASSSSSASRAKSPPNQQQHHSLSHYKSLTSLHQSSLDAIPPEQSIFGPASLPSTSTFSSLHAQAQLSQAATTIATQPPKRKTSFYKRKRSQTTATGSAQATVDSNGFPIPSPMSEIVKSMPLHGRMSHDVLHQPLPDLPPKRSTSAGNSNATGGTGAGSGNGGGGGFLSSITRKLSHPHLKDSNSAPNPSTFPPDVDPVAADISLDYFVGAAPTPPASHHSAPQQHESPKLGSSFSSRSWLHPFGGGGDHHQQQSKNDNKALPQIPQARSSSASNSKNNHVYGDPFSASSTMSLPGFLHRSPRKDSLSSDKSEQSNGNRRKSPRSRTISQDGDSSEGHSSEVGGMTGNAFYPSLRNYDLAPPVPEVPFGMRTLQSTAGSPPSVLASSALPKASKKMSGLLRSPSLGGSGRGKKSAPQQTSEGDLSPTTPRAAVFPSISTSTSVSYGNVIWNEDSLPSPTKAGMLVISKANESLNTARLSGLGNSLSSPRTNKTSNPSDNDEYYPTTSSNDSNQIPSKLGTIAAMDKIATIENNIKEARFLALWDRSERSEMGVIKLSLTSNAAREAGIA